MSSNLNIRNVLNSSVVVLGITVKLWVCEDSSLS